MDNFRRLTVSQINEYIGMVFDSDVILSNLCICGEISDFKFYQTSGHMYFTLKDEDSVIKSVMFKSNAMKLRFIPRNGMKVMAMGRVGVYSKSGAYQLYVSSMVEDGKGSEAEALERLKKKLASEGLFDEKRKRPIPEFPRAIGIVTSLKGAALQDILNVSGRRWPLSDIVICPSSVQGDTASRELCEAMSYFNTYGGVDVIIIGRGGGSGEDLSAFNDEALARLVGASPVPVISAVGHQTDFTICDFVADKREPTPSAAAERATPDMDAVEELLLKNCEAMKSDMLKTFGILRQRLSSLESGAGMSSSENYISLKRLELENMQSSIEGEKNAYFIRKSSELENYSVKYLGLNPLAVLSRGYSYVTNEEGINVRSANDVCIGQDLRVTFEDSDINVKVTKKNCDE